MEHKAINLEEKLAQFNDQWQPKIIARMNDYDFKLVKLQGDFVWHSHAETDEVFIVIKGEMGIEFRDGTVTLNQGEMLVVPKGSEHKPFAQEECHLMLVEPIGTVNTGDEGGSRTVEAEWV